MPPGRAIVIGLLSLAGALASPAAAADWPARPIVEIPFDRRLISGALYSLGLSPLKGADDLLFEPPSLLTLLPGVRFDSSFVEKEAPALAGIEPGWRLIDATARASAQLWGGRIRGEAELLGYATHASADTELVAEATPRLIRFGMTEIWGDVESGIRFESVSPGLENITGAKIKGDREGSEAWLALRTGDVRFKGVVSEFGDNVADDPRRGRTTRAQAGSAIELTLPAGSLATLAVARGTAAHVLARRGERRAVGSDSSDFQSATFTFYHYGGPTWDVALSTTYTVNATAAPAGQETTSLSHDVSASYGPTAAVRVAPALSLWQEASGTGVDSEGLSASLSVTVTPLVHAFDMSLYSGYTRSLTTDGAFDGRSLDATASLVWNLRRWGPKTTLSFEVGYHRYLDYASGAGRYAELVGQLLLKLAAF